MNNINPLVSIVIPVYNGSNYLREAIDSALAQTYKNIEVIVVNDGSNDSGKTREIALSYGDRICYFEKENGGVASALNLAIKEMRGEFFSWLSHDDLYYPDKIEKQVDFYLSLKDDRVVVFSDEDIIDSRGSLIRKGDNIKKDFDELVYNLLLYSFIGGCSLLIPKVAFEKCGNFNESLKCAQDYEMWFKMIKSGYALKYLPIILGQSRIHPDQDSKRKKDILIEDDNKFRVWVLENFLPEELWGKDKDNFRYYIKTAAIFAQRELKQASNVSLMKASKYKPGNSKLFYYKIKIGLISGRYQMIRNIRAIIRYFKDIL